MGVVTAGLLIISGNSATAVMNQGTTLPENYNTSSAEQPSNANYNIDNDKTQEKDTVDEQELKNLVETIPSNEILLAGCITTNQGTICSWPW
ncbi:hypothetical protein [Nostoc sp. FACHB-190]|uniref:hypothetical protein n=1 Tax=Nostoc sp. FACHB-190 TaxID=2692838 RepID=UPI00168638A9|nr:hypothetical protein [Nostoc sp. FACHB-190]MBD2297452.1 hypothetical protein [Nostoc sp. FACHB-190]